MELFTILLGAAVFLLLILFLHLTKNNGKLEALGIPVVRRPLGLLLGSGPMDFHNHVIHRVYQEQFCQFGNGGAKTYGKYDGVVPVVVTVDPEVVRSVLVKNFENFSDTFSEVKTKQVTFQLAATKLPCDPA